MIETGPTWERGGSCTDDDNGFDEGISYGNSELEIRAKIGRRGGTNQQNYRSPQVSSLFPDRKVTRKVRLRQQRQTNISSQTTTTPAKNVKQHERERDSGILEGNAPT